MTTSPAVDHLVAGTEVTLRVERHPDHLDLGLLGDLGTTDPEALDAVEQALIEAGADTDADAFPTVRLLSGHPPDRIWPLPTVLAERLGFDQVRDLFQLRRSLPIPPEDPNRPGTPALVLRPFGHSTDADAWIRTNNRAFATHPDQGEQTSETLADTLAESWVDLDGFLVADDPAHPGDLIGSCWTRVHPPTDDDPELGEIYVIGVDPRHHGRGLGQALVLAGLDHLAGRGIATGMLYVEADNEPALRLYRRLGFETHLRYRICTR